ncbi:MAG: TetR/AcrR family transcriptional regulator [Myxococcota bacterium]
MSQTLELPPTKPPIPPSALGDDRMGQLLHKVAELMARDGFAATSMRDVAKATELSPAGVYHHFASKQDLLYQLQLRVFTSLLDALAQAEPGVVDPTERLRALVHRYLAFFTAHSAELRVCTFELQSLDGAQYRDVERLRRRLFKQFATVVEGLAAARGETLSGEAVRHRTLFVFGALNWVFMWFNPVRDAPAEALGDRLCDLVLDGIGGRPDGR